jgi:hypothetical protein
MSTHERYRRGLPFKGLSSIKDLGTGGADSVFTRIVTEEGLRGSYNLELESKNAGYNVVFIFEPDILDRTDWYSYSRDFYGSTKKDDFEERLSPKDLIEEQKKYWTSINEQMFRTGITMEKVKAIACASEYEVVRVLKILQNAGISEINGRRIEQMVVMAPRVRDFIRISQGEEIEHTKPIEEIMREHRQLQQKKIDGVIPSLSQAITELQILRPVLEKGDIDSATATKMINSSIEILNKALDKYEYSGIFKENLFDDQKKEILQTLQQLVDLVRKFQREELFNLPYEGEYKREYVEMFLSYEERLNKIIYLLS